MKLLRLVALSLGTTLVSVFLAVALAAILIPEQRTWWEGGVTCALLGLMGWIFFFLPVVVWEARRVHPFPTAGLALLGFGLGALVPLLTFILDGSYIWEWRGGQTLRLTLLAPVVGLLSGLMYSLLRPAPPAWNATGRGRDFEPRDPDSRELAAPLSAKVFGAISRVVLVPTQASEASMKRVTGIGGIFFKAKDAPALRVWYRDHLGIDVQEWGGAAFLWSDSDGKPTGGSTVWSVAPEESEQFAPSKASFMVNYRVEDLHALVAALKAEGCDVLDKVEESEYGKFAWVVDPEGNKVELWQPPAGQ